jgi:protein subunit release factor B
MDHHVNKASTVLQMAHLKTNGVTTFQAVLSQATDSSSQNVNIVTKWAHNKDLPKTPIF